eukprot:5701326-Amphidinium_carterae.1
MLPAPEPEPEVVESAKKTEFPAAPFRHVGVHAGHKCFNYHTLKGKPCVPLKRQKRSKLVSGFHSGNDVPFVHSASSGGRSPLAGIG